MEKSISQPLLGNKIKNRNVYFLAKNKILVLIYPQMPEENKEDNDSDKLQTMSYDRDKDKDSGLWYYLNRMPLIIPFVIPIRMYRKK